MTAVLTTLPMETSTADDDGPHDDRRVLTSIAVIESLLMIAGVFGNTMLFILMRSKKFTSHSFSVYMSFAAVFDTLTIFWNSLQDLYEVNHKSSLEEDAIGAYTFGCGILELFDGWFPMTSAWIMVLLCVDRYVSICRPNAGQTFCRRPVAFIACGLVVLCAFVLSLPWSLISPDKEDNDPGPVLCSDEADDNLQGYDVVELILLLFIPLLIVTVLNALILIVLRKKKAFRTEESLTQHGQLQTQINRLNVAIFYLLVITMVTWLPYAVTNLVEMSYFDLEHHSDKTMVRVDVDYAWHVTLVLWLLTFAQDFYVLLLLSPVYRTEMRRQCACLPWFSRIKYDRVEVNNELSDKEGSDGDN